MDTKKIVLVTGASGFVGSNLVRELIRIECEVHVILREESKMWRLNDIKNKLIVHKGDLLNPVWTEETIKNVRPSYIFNLAQYGGYPFQKDENQMWATNLTGTINLLNAAEKVGFKKFIQTGSSSEYGRKERPMNESDIIEPNSAYAVSKASATLYCAHRGREGNLPIVILRLFSIYGPWEEPTRLLPSMINKYTEGKPIELVSPEIARDFVYIDDVVKALMCAMEAKTSGEIINISSGIQTTLKNALDQLSNIVGQTIPVIWGKTQGRSFDTNIWVGNPEKAIKALNWRAETSFKEGLEKTLSWFQKNKELYVNQ